jgi:predicted nuclease of predicted toxin-antitoxin system
MARLFVDEDVPWAAVDHLRTLGHDVLTVDEVGRKGAADADQLAFAAADGRAVVTHNRRHFLRLHRRDDNHAGIIICTRDDADPIGLAGRIHAAVTAAGALDRRLLRVNRPQPSP